MGTLAALVTVDKAREDLQKSSNYLVNLTKQYVYTTNEAHVPVIQKTLFRVTQWSTLAVPKGSLTQAFHSKVTAALQRNLNKTKNIIANISKLTNVHENLLYSCSVFQEEYNTYLLRIPCASRGTHDEAITTAVANALNLGTLTNREKLLMQRKISNHGLGLNSIESNLEFLFLASFMKNGKINKTFIYYFWVCRRRMVRCNRVVFPASGLKDQLCIRG